MKWKEFSPTIYFLLKFVGFYLIGNLLYGLFVTTFEPKPDPMTKWVTNQTAWVITVSGWPAETVHHSARPTTSILYQNQAIVSVYEGCNGINVMIVFLAFVFAFGPIGKTLSWFAPVALLIIHISNLLRIIFLFWVTLYLPNFLYLMHKYFFTAFIYAIVFIIWIIWVKKFAITTREEP